MTGFPEMLAKRKPIADRHRRSALHFAMGARFSPRLPHARPVPAVAAPRAGHRADRHRDADRAGRYRRAAGPRSRRRVSSTASGATTSRSKWSKSRRRSAPRLAQRTAAATRRAGPAIVYAPTRKQADALAARTGSAIFPPRPITPGWTPSTASACRRSFWRADRGDGRHHRLRHGHR